MTLSLHGLWRLIPFCAESTRQAGSSFVSHAHVDAGVDTSCKTAFVMSLLAELVAKGHRTLIFSQSRVMLDILQAAIVEQSYAFRRIDGSISSAAERQVSVFTCMPAVHNLACRLAPYKALNQVAVW